MPADPVAAVVAFLKSDPLLDSLHGGRVFGGELPAHEAKQMPRAVVVVQPAGGGLLGTADQDYGDTRLDVDCYAATAHEAWLLHLAVSRELKHVRRSVLAGTLLHWARPASGGTLARDPDTDWPIAVSSWQVLAADEPIT